MIVFHGCFATLRIAPGLGGIPLRGHLGICPEDPVILAEAVEQVMSLAEAERGILGQRGKAYVIKHHNYTVLARRFLEAMALAPAQPPRDSLKARRND